jgi:hypothetical protein
MKSITLLLLDIALISADPECKQELKSFPAVVRTGYYIDDLGCYYETLTNDGKDYPYKDRKKVFAKGMFLKKGDNHYVNYINQVFYHNDRMMGSSADWFGKPTFKFSIPTVTNEGANYIIKGWAS